MPTLLYFIIMGCDIMINEGLKKFLLDNIKDARPASNGREVCIRCRFCGDSQKDSNARHLYISLGDGEKPPMYHCFKCNTSGILTKDILTQWIPNVAISELDGFKLNKSGMTKRYTDSNKRNVIYNFYIPRGNVPTDKEQAALNYINSRLGTNMSYYEAIYNKIILDVRRFAVFNNNRINKELYIPDVDSYVGFLSIDNSSVVLRDFTGSAKHRYMHLHLTTDRNSKTLYCIPSVVNRMKGVHIHIAEGVFDILGVFYNLKNADRNQNIYITSNGKDHRNTIIYCLTNLSLFNPVIELYLDSDTNKEDYYWIKNKLRDINIPVIFHKNNYFGEKDFGVPSERIVDAVLK